MIGNLYINDKDVWTNWSAGLTAGSYCNLLLAAPTKEYVSNNMRSQDGTQYYISNPKVAEREVIITFGIMCKSTDDYLVKYTSLIQEFQKGIILLRVPKLKTTYKLLFTSAMELITGDNTTGGTLSVRFTEPNPKDRIAL